MKLSSLLSPARIREYIRVRKYCGAVRHLAGIHRLPDINMSLQRLKDCGFSPRSIFDIGSYDGETLETCWRLWPGCTVVAFEPQEEKARQLGEKFRGHPITLEQRLVGDADRNDVPFYVDATASSVLSSDECGTKKAVRHLKMVRLDSYLQDAGLPPPNLLHIDVVSFEYQILAGLGKRLQEVEAIITQLNYIEVFHGVRLAHEVIGLLSEHGFVMYDVCDVHRRPLDNALWQMDALFVKADSPMRQNKRWG